MNANLHQVASGPEAVLYIVQAPAIAAVLTRTLHKLGPTTERLTLNNLPESTADRFADAFAGKPVANMTFARNEGGKWFLRVERQVAPAAAPAPKQADAFVDTIDTHAKGKHRCPQCDGTGHYISGYLNDKPIIGGICYRCKGKGYTTEIDRRRNLRYQEYAASRVA